MFLDSSDKKVIDDRRGSFPEGHFGKSELFIY